MNFRNHPRARRVASYLSTLSLIAYSTSFVAPVYAQNPGTPPPTQTTPEKVKKQDELDRAKKVTPPAPGNPAVFIDPNTGSGNNLRDFNRDGTPRVPYQPKRDYGDHQSRPTDPRMVADNKDLPMFGYNYFDSARQALQAKHNGLSNILSGGNNNNNSNSNSANRNSSRNSSRDNNGSRNSDTRDNNPNNSGNSNSNGDNNRSGSDTDNNGNRRNNSNDTTESSRDSRDNQDARDARDNSDTSGTTRNDDGVSDAQRRRDARNRDADSTDAALEDSSTVQGRLQGLSGRNNNGGANDNSSDRNNGSNRSGNRSNANNGNYQNNQNSPNIQNNFSNAPGTRSTVSGYEGIIDPITQLTNNIIASPPATYQLSAGDEVVIHINTPKLNPMDINRTVDAVGNLDLGEMGRMIVRGKTLDQLETDLQQRALRYYKGAQVYVNLKQLRSITVTVQGEAVEPGSYVVPAVVSAFNMLNAVGGPTPDGSLREIKVMRQGKVFKVLDFYKFIKGDGQDDVILRAGDIVVIPSSGARVALTGEVRKPALYEMKDDESLRDALKFAGGVKASGVDQIVQLNTIEPGQNRVLKNINLREKAQVEATRLYDGDSVEIHSVRQIVDNKVHISGAISQEGDYALTPGMKIADLLRLARNPISEAYLGRAALKRWNGDNTTTLISIDLGKAIENDPQNNIPLMKWDSLEIYSRMEATFVGTRKIEVRGAVQREGVYEYSQNMRVLDILLKAGGPLPTAERIEIIHQHGDGTYGLEPVLVADVAHGDPAKNVVLQDNDIVAVYKNTEAQFIATHQVRVEGEVVTAGFYPRAEGMRLTDALRLAGNFRPGAHPNVKIAHARRSVDSKEANGGIVSVQFDTQLRCAPQDDIRLEDGDVIAVQGTGGIDERPPVVYVRGAVNSPGPIFLKNKNVRLSDAIAEAGGLRPEAFPEGAEFNRDPARLSSKTQKELSATIGKLTNLLNDQAYNGAVAEADIERLKALNSTNDSSGSLLGGGQQSGGALNNAAGVAIASKLADHPLVTEPRRLTEKELDPSGNIAVNLPAALDQSKRTSGRRDDDILLMDGDTITVPEKPTTIQVIGAVINQRGVLFLPGKPLDYYIAQSGGYAPDAAIKTIEVIRAGGGITPANKVKDLRPGDVILVPTKVLAARIAQHHDGIGDFFKSITNSAIIFKLATGVFGL